MLFDMARHHHEAASVFAAEPLAPLPDLEIQDTRRVLITESILTLEVSVYDGGHHDVDVTCTRDEDDNIELRVTGYSETGRRVPANIAAWVECNAYLRGLVERLWVEDDRAEVMGRWMDALSARAW